MGKLGTVHDRTSVAARHNYNLAEVKRLTSEGISISKISKMLGIHYQLAKTLKDLASSQQG